jgi:hypothetical protein
MYQQMQVRGDRRGVFVLGWVDGGADGGTVLGRVALECQKVAAVPLPSSPARVEN